MEFDAVLLPPRRARMIEHFAQPRAVWLGCRGPIGLYIGSKHHRRLPSVSWRTARGENGVTLPSNMQVGPAKESMNITANASTGQVCGVPRG